MTRRTGRVAHVLVLLLDDNVDVSKVTNEDEP